MAPLDDRVTPVVVSNGFASSGSITFGAAPSSGDLIVLLYCAANNITGGPSGFTEIDSGTWNSQTRSKVYAKVAGSSEPTTYTATFGASATWSGIGRRIEGPFTDLSTLTYSGEIGGYGTSIRILNTNVTVAATTKVIAMFTSIESNDFFSSATNGFANLQQSNAGPRVIQVDRLYTTSATDVHTQLTLTNPGYGRETLLRIQAPAVTQSNAPRSMHYSLNGMR